MPGVGKNRVVRIVGGERSVIVWGAISATTLHPVPANDISWSS